MAAGNRFRLSEAERGIVVFHIWQSLGYRKRLLLSFSLVIAGLAVQPFYVFLGWPLILAGTLLLLVKGYDNRVDSGRLDPLAQWEPVGIKKLRELVALDKQIQKWDRSIMDVTNAYGFLALIVFLALAVLMVIFLPSVPQVLAIDLAILLLPHWFTGTRRIMRLPKLVVKAQAQQEVLDVVAAHIEGWKLDVLMELKGKDVQLPQDVKFRLMPEEDQAGAGGDGFLGFYGQCATNDVQGASYPYLYTVSVAKKGFGLEKVYNEYQAPGDIVKEFDAKDEVETLVIRQNTKIRQGYHTKPEQALKVFQEGFTQAGNALAYIQRLRKK